MYVLVFMQVDVFVALAGDSQGSHLCLLPLMDGSGPLLRHAETLTVCMCDVVRVSVLLAVGHEERVGGELVHKVQAL